LTIRSDESARLAAFERETSNQVVVAIVPSLDGQPIEDLAVHVVERSEGKLVDFSRPTGELRLREAVR
jgi:uncharacterized membrane protein YgcG